MWGLKTNSARIANNTPNPASSPSKKYIIRLILLPKKQSTIPIDIKIIEKSAFSEDNWLQSAERSKVGQPCGLCPVI